MNTFLKHSDQLYLNTNISKYIKTLKVLLRGVKKAFMWPFFFTGVL